MPHLGRFACLQKLINLGQTKFKRKKSIKLTSTAKEKYQNRGIIEWINKKVIGSDIHVEGL